MSREARRTRDTGQYVSGRADPGVLPRDRNLQRLAGIAPSYLSKIENGRIQPTFPTLWRIMRALHAGFEDVVGPESVLERRLVGCPISASGECLAQLIRSEAEVARDRRRVFVSTREVRLLRELLAWMKGVSADHAHALEVLLEDVIRTGSRELGPGV